MLRAQGLRVAYGTNEVLRGLDLTVAPGEIVALLGLNGSGKSTTVKAIAGLVAPSGGSVTVADEEISGWSVRRRVQAGITLVAQGRTLFEGMTVSENLSLGAFVRTDAEAVKADESRWLDRVSLSGLGRRKASALSGGQQRLVAVARGMMANPRFLLLDEPSLGVAPAILTDLRDVLHGLRDDLGVGILLVEQDIPFALATADRVVLLSRGTAVLEERAEHLRGGQEIRRMFFELGA